MHILALTLLVGCSPTDTSLTNTPGEGDIVTGTGKMSLDVTEIAITEVQLGYSKSGSFTVESIGDGNLQIYEIRIVADPTEAFFFDEVEDVELAPGQTATFTVVADLDEDEPATGELRLRTSDPDAANFILPLAAYPQGWVPPEDTGPEDTGGEDSGGGA